MKQLCCSRSGMIGIAALLCAGCSVNEFGVAQTSVWGGHGQGGITQSFTAPGLHFSTREDNPSVTLGLFEAQRLYSTCARASSQNEAVKTRPANLDLHVLYLRARGIRLTLGPNEQGISIGIHERLVSRTPPDGGHFIRAAHLSARAPETSRLTFDQQENCSNTLEISQ